MDCITTEQYEEYFDTQVITTLVFEISKNIIDEQKEEMEKNEALYKLASIIYLIGQYEKENGNIKTLINKLND